VAKILRQPVKVVWTREDDVRGGFYRTCAMCRLTATLDAQHRLTSWSHRLAAQPNVAHPAVEELMQRAGLEVRTTQGATEMPYAVPNVSVDAHSMFSPVTVQWMRSVSNSFNVFAVETFIDEVAQAAGRDPYAFRHDLLQARPRHQRVLDAVAAAAGWGSPPPAGVQRGIAVFSSYGSFIAQVVEASVGEQRELSIRRVISAVDCGVSINPDLVKAQIESAVIFALSSALFGEITLDHGLVQQGNFHDYPVLRMYQTPVIETLIVDSGDAPGGVGELGVPCVAPALANAIFAATGERMRSLPLRRQNLHIA
jgi:isoquinoline 1-oxidoreductase beta subunit